MMKSTGVAIIFITGCVGIISVLASNLSPQSRPMIPEYRPGSLGRNQGYQGIQGGSLGRSQGYSGIQGGSLGRSQEYAGIQEDSIKGGERSQDYVGFPGGSLGWNQGYPGIPGDGSEQLLAQCRALYNANFDVENLPAFCNKFIGTGQLTGLSNAALRNLGGWAPGVQGGYGGFPGGWNTGIQGGYPGGWAPGIQGGYGGLPGGLRPGYLGGR